MNPLITIAIPVYNRAGMIRDAIESVIGQSGDDVELIIIDNCSTDETYEVACEYLSKCVKVFRNEHNVGMGMNFVRCIEEAKGEWFRFLMSDDMFLPGAIDLMRHVIKEHPDADIQFSDGAMNDDGLIVSSSKNCVKVVDAIDYNKAQKRWEYHRFPALPNAYCIRVSQMQEMILDADFLALFRSLAKTGHCIDYAMLIYNTRKAKKIALIDVPTYCLRVHSKQGSGLYRFNIMHHLTGDYAVVDRIYGLRGFERMWFYPHALSVYVWMLRHSVKVGIAKSLGVTIGFLHAIIYLMGFQLGVMRGSAVRE